MEGNIFLGQGFQQAGIFLFFLLSRRDREIVFSFSLFKKRRGGKMPWPGVSLCVTSCLTETGKMLGSPRPHDVWAKQLFGDGETHTPDGAFPGLPMTQKAPCREAIHGSAHGFRLLRHSKFRRKLPGNAAVRRNPRASPARQGQHVYLQGGKTLFTKRALRNILRVSLCAWPYGSAGVTAGVCPGAC